MPEQDIKRLQREIESLKQQLSEARRNQPPEPVEDHALARPDGETVRLSELFRDHDDLIVVHNMGRGCAYCTMWADGFNGVLPHLEDRASFVVVSRDPPESLLPFAATRGWTFQMVSSAGTGFTEAMGFDGPDATMYPGVSALHRKTDGTIVRTGKDIFGPGDDYSSPWRLFDLLVEGVGAWQPRVQYSGEVARK
jgi:predicted dithiol-disulfide oxidoreductase (DUF899 family)